ncbi:MAG: DUF4198 domain-containing protein [Boseongicola sp.]
MFRSFALAVSFTCIAMTAKGHEFWIEPENYQVEVGSEVVAELRIGQNFSGASQSYLPHQFRRFDFATRGQVAPITGRLGDRPAARVETSDDGLLVLIHETSDLKITWSEFEKFENFLKHKDAAWVLEVHDSEGLSQIDVAEVYSRYAKSLVAAGAGTGSDFEAGLETEIVALENPYTDDMSDGINVRVLYQGHPRPNEQIEVFEKSDDGEVNIFTLHTDGDGTVTIPVNSGHEYMLDSVVLRKPSEALASSKNVTWESLWANLTFAVPANQ